MGKQNSQKNSTLVCKMIENMKQEKQNMKREGEQRQKLFEEQRRRYIKEIQAYKRKVVELTEINIMNTMCKVEICNDKK